METISKSKQARESRDRIVKAAEELFSEKGFDGTSVTEITKKAGVNKALIYYYFKSKDDILQYLLDTLSKDIKNFALAELNSIVQFVKKGYMTVERGKLKIKNIDQAFERYVDSLVKKTLDFYMQRKRVFRVMVMESLKKGGQSALLFRIADLLKDDISAYFVEKGVALNFDKSVLVERFFMGLMPMVSFALYYDDWKEYYHMSEEELQAIFIEKCKMNYAALAHF